MKKTRGRKSRDTLPLTKIWPGSHTVLIIFLRESIPLLIWHNSSKCDVSEFLFNLIDYVVLNSFSVLLRSNTLNRTISVITNKGFYCPIMRANPPKIQKVPFLENKSTINIFNFAFLECSEIKILNYYFYFIFYICSLGIF